PGALPPEAIDSESFRSWPASLAAPYISICVGRFGWTAVLPCENQWQDRQLVFNESARARFGIQSRHIRLYGVGDARCARRAIRQAWRGLQDLLRSHHSLQ